MKKLIFTFILFSVAKLNFAQNVGVNPTGAAPDLSAMLDIVAADKGLLVPRVALTATNSALPVTAPTVSLLVYNTATAGAAPNAVTPGYYYWNGSAWIRFVVEGEAWSILGNTGTVAVTNFLGTTDAVDLVFRTNNIEKMRIQSGGNVGIGDASPVALFTVGSGDLFQINLTGNALGILGTAALPSFSFVADPNTGIYRSAVDEISVTTAGTRKVVVEADGDVGIGVAPVAGGAKLDVTATDKGILIPRVALVATNNNAPIGATITTSVMVYNTATAGAAPNGVYPGHYYWNGTRWVRQVDNILERWVYPPLNLNPSTTYTLTALITGCTSTSTATVNLYGDWATSPDVTIKHVEAQTGAVRFQITNNSPFTTYLGMDFIITTIR